MPSAFGMDYATDAVGNITQLAQTVNGATRTQAIVYDNLNRLKEVREASALIEGYSYDATGNRLSRQPGTQASEAYTYGAASHRLGSVAGTARAYDAAGNTGSIASTPAIELIHDQRNRLTEYRSGGSMLTSYQYSGRGERVAKTQGAATQRFVYDEAGRLIYETGSGSPRTYLWSDDAPIAVIDGTTLTGYIVPHNLGTPRAITNSAGTAIWRWDQVSGSTTTGGSAVFGQGAANTDPDGNGTHLTFNPRFPGQYLDAESGLHYNYFRDYEPGTGRYVQSDPVGLWGGVTTYLYVDGDPSFRIDPFGLRGAPTRPPPVRTNRLTQAIREALQNSQRRADGVRPAPDPSNPGPQPPPRLPPGGPDPYNNNPLEDQLKVCFGFMTFDNGCVQPDEYRWEPARRCINLKCPSPWPPSCPQNDPPQQHMFASGSSSRGGCYCVDWDWTAVKVRN